MSLLRPTQRRGGTEWVPAITCRSAAGRRPVPRPATPPPPFPRPCRASNPPAPPGPGRGPLRGGGVAEPPLGEGEKHPVPELPAAGVEGHPLPERLRRLLRPARPHEQRAAGVQEHVPHLLGLLRLGRGG